MGKKFTYLLVLLGALNLCLTQANAQTVELNHTPTAVTATEGDTVTLGVTVQNFTDIFGLQGTISWDATKMSFLDIPTLNLTGLSAPGCAGVCSFITTFANDGDLLLNWFSAVGETVADGTQIYEIRFKMIGDGLDTVAFTDNRIDFLASVLQGGDIVDITPVTENANFTIFGNANGSPCDTFIEFGAYTSSDSIQNLEQTCLDVKVCGFNDIVGFAYTTQFDPNILQYDSIINIHPEISNAVLGTTNIGQGLLSISWFDTAATNIPDETTIYQICFTGIGAGGTRDTVLINSAQTPFDAVNSSQTDLIVGSAPGYVTIEGTSQAAVSVFASDEILEIPGDTCVDVQVRNFVDMLSLSYTMEWDENIIDFDTILDPNNFFDGMLAGSVNTSPSAVDTGALILNWFSPGIGSTPITLADSTVIYQVCFNDVGDAGETSAVEFTGSQIAQLAVQDDGSGGSNTIPLSTTDGSVELTSVDPMDGFVFTLSDHDPCPGDTFTVDFIAQGWVDITSMSFLLRWDTLDLEWVGLHDNILPPLFGANTTPQFTDSAKISVFFFDNSLQGVNFPDGTVLFQMDFKAIGLEGEMDSIYFTEDGTPTGISLNAGDVNGPIVDPGINDSQIEFTCSTGPDPTLSNVITNLDCFGDGTGAIDVTVINGNDPLMFNWEGPDSYTATTEDISDLAAGTYNLTFTDGGGTVIMDAFVITEPDSLVLSSTTTNASCGGGTDGAIDLTVDGGTSNFTYVWDSGLDPNQDQGGLSAGTYCVTVTDMNSCTANICITVEEDNAPTLSFTNTDASCNGGADGTIDLSVAGGTPDFTYVWDSGLDPTQDQSGLTAGTYCVTVTDMNSCEVMTCVTIDENGAPTISADLTNVSCNGDNDGEIDLTISGGVDPYIFVWDNGLDPTEDQVDLTAGEYKVTVTDDQGCMVIDSFTISEPDELIVTETHIDIDCNGDGDGSIDLEVTGGTTDYQFNWDSGLPATQNQSSLDGGTYNVTVTDDNGCEKILSITIDEPTALTLSGDVQNDSGLGDGSIDITVGGGTPMYDYNWDGGLADVEDQTGLSPGTYTVIVTDDNGCVIQDTYTISGVAPPTITNVDITDAGCSGTATGAIDITVENGVPVLMYNWSGPNSFGAVTEDIADVVDGDYFVTVTDGAGTEITGGPYTINQSTSITYTEIHTNTTCSYREDGSISLGISGGSSPYTVAWNGGLVGEQINDLAPGTYTPTISDNGGCEQIGQGITIEAAPEIAINVLDQEDVTCFGDFTGSILIEVTGGTGASAVTWAPAGSGLSLANLSDGNYTPTAVDANGCEFVGSTIVIDQPNSRIRANEVIDQISCNGEADGSINIAATGGNGAAYGITWDPAVNVNNDDDIFNLSPGSYSLTITDALGCPETFGPFAITEPDAITEQAFIDNASSSNDDGMITLVANGGTGNYDFNWDGPGAPFPNDNVISGLASGTYDVTISDQEGCSITASYLVEGAIGVNYAINDVSCNGEDDGSILQTSISGGVGPYTYEWNTVPARLTPDLTDVGPGTYQLTITDFNGMLIVQSYDVDEPVALSINVTNVIHESGLGCNGSISVSVDNGNDPYTYNWSNGLSSPTIVDLCKGDYSVEIIDDEGCIVNSDIITINPAALGVTNIDVMSGACFGDNNGAVCLEYYGGCGPYSLSLDGGDSFIDIDNAVCFDDLTGGDHSLTIVDNFGETFTQTLSIPQYEEITAATTITNNSAPAGADCNGAINLTVNSGQPVFSFQWSHGPTSEDVDGLCADLSPYSVIITDGNGCVTEVNNLVVENGISVDAEIVDLCDPANCDGEIFIDPVGGEMPYSYNWSNATTNQDLIGVCAGEYTVTVSDNSGMQTIQTYNISAPTMALEAVGVVTDATSGMNGAIDLTASGGYGNLMYQWESGQTSADIAGLGAGTYVVTVTDNNDCQIVRQFTVVGEGQIVTFTPDEPSCTGFEDGCLEAQVNGNGTPPYNYVWSNGLGGKKICNIGAGEYSVTITDANGIVILSDPITLEEPAPLLITIEDTGDGTAEAIVQGGTPGYNYNWSDANNTQEAIVMDLEPGMYTVLVTDAAGCISMEPLSYFPDGDCTETRNIITPNNDGENDEFLILCAYTFLDNELTIFDRWGQLVYKTAGYDNTWTGFNQSNEALSEGGYFYLFEYREPGTGILRQEKGHITIVK